MCKVPHFPAWCIFFDLCRDTPGQIIFNEGMDESLKTTNRESDCMNNEAGSPYRLSSD